jgi:hypothetical protein
MDNVIIVMANVGVGEIDLPSKRSEFVLDGGRYGAMDRQAEF